MTAAAYDLAIVGAGPAGTAAALRALQLAPGASVVLLDRESFPRDKPCGDGISAHAVVELATLGALAAVDGHPPVRDFRLRSPCGVEVCAPPPQACVVVPRATFDARLVGLAAERGAEVRRHRVRGVERLADRVVLDGAIEARVVIGADGANSAVRRSLGVPPNRPRDVAIAVRGYTERSPVPPDEMAIVLEEPGSLAYAWAFPLPGGGANVGYGRSAAAARADAGGGGGAGTAALAARMRALLPGLGDVRDLRAHRLPLASAPVRQPDGRVLLAGDALSYVNPITGEGIHHALRSGRLAAEAALGHAAVGDAAVGDAIGGDPGAAYRRALRLAFGPHLRQTAAMARLCRLPGFTDAAFELAGRRTDVWHAICDTGMGSGTVPARLVARQLAAYAAWPARRGSVVPATRGR